MPLLDVGAIRSACPLNTVHYFQSVGSTMTEAQQLAVSGAPSGTVVLADEQTAGKGRLGRHWHSAEGVGIYSSLLLRLPVSPEILPVVTLALGLATAQAIEGSSSLSCDLRWPNDVLVRGRKVAGILTQLLNGCVIAGVGINVNQNEMPSNLRTPATSLCLESGGQLQSREAILIRLLHLVGDWCDTLQVQGREAVLRAFTQASSFVLDRRVTLEESGHSGITAGLDKDGFLLVRLDSGVVERVTSGGIRPAQEAHA